MRDESRRIRVLVVDDSAVIRRLISSLLERDAGVEVVATALDGDFALSKIEQVKPDVVTMDVDMPRMDGLTALRHIVSKYSIPVVMLSSLTTRGATLTMQALKMGAFDFVCKPKGGGQVGEMAEDLISKVKAAAQAGAIPLDAAAPGPAVEKRVPTRKAAPTHSDRVVAIGASSGGPHALRYLLPRIPADIDAGIVLVQHMPRGFTGMLARCLDEICELTVMEAREGALALPGRVLVAPASAHMKLRETPRGPEIILERGLQVNGHMPSVDVLFGSVARAYGPRAVGVIMTGMGGDGAQGLGEIKRVGGVTAAQDRESCSIFGMPRVAIEKGFVDTVLPLGGIADFLIATVGLQSQQEGAICRE